MSTDAPPRSIQLTVQLLDRFDTAPPDEQQAVREYLGQLRPDLEAPGKVDVVEPVTTALTGALGQREWWGTDEECATQLHLYRAGAALREVPTLVDSVEAALLADAQRVFGLPFAVDAEAIGRL